MHPNPTDVTPVVVAVAAGVTTWVIVSHLLAWRRVHALRLRLLTGTQSQRAALQVALTPVLREFLPLLDKAGQDVRAIVLVPTLSDSGGEPLGAEVDQLGGSSAVVVRLAHRIGSTVRQPEDVAGTLAENLLYLYRDAASVIILRQTAAAAGGEQHPLTPKAASRNGLASGSRHAAQNEAEETVLQFKPSPLGRNNNQGA
jgi:hypothetical protein